MRTAANPGQTTDSKTLWRRLPRILALVALLLVPLLAGGTQAQAVTVINVSLPTNGSDVTAAVQAKINSAPNYSILRFPAGRYRMDGTIMIKGRTGLTLEGASVGQTVFYATGKGPLSNGLSWRRHVVVAGGSSITLRRLHIEGTNTVANQYAGYGDFLPAYEHEHGFAFIGVRTAVLEDSSAKGVFGDGVYIGNDGRDLGSSSAYSSNVRVSRVSLSWIGRQGVGVTHAYGVLLDGVKVHARLCGIDLEPNQRYQFARNIQVKNSTINALLIAFGATGPGDASNVWIHHNTIDYNGNWPMVSHDMSEARSSYWRVEDNVLKRTLTKSSWAGMEFHGVRNVAVRRNTMSFDPSSAITAVKLVNSSGYLYVTNNSFMGAYRVVSTGGTTSLASVLMSSNLTSGQTTSTTLAPTTTTTVRPTTTTTTVRPTTTTTLAPTTTTTKAPTTTTTAPATGGINVSLPTSGDVTSTVQAAINSAPNGATLRFPAGRYRMDGTIKVQSRTNLTLEGSASGQTVFYATSKGALNSSGLSWRRHFLVVGGSGITVRRLHIEGTNTVANQQSGHGDYLPAYEHEHGFSFVGVVGMRLEDSSVKGVFGDGLYIGNDGHEISSSIPTKNVTVLRTNLSYIGRQGVGLTHVDGLLFDGVTVKARLQGIDFEPNQSSQYAKNLEIRNSSVNAVNIAFNANGNGNVSNVYIHHNTVPYSGNWPALSVSMSSGQMNYNWRVEDNVFQRTYTKVGVPGMSFNLVNGVVVSRNKMSFQSSSALTAVRLNNASGTMQVTGNTFTGAATAFSASGTTSGSSVTASGNIF